MYTTPHFILQPLQRWPCEKSGDIEELGTDQGWILAHGILTGALLEVH